MGVVTLSKEGVALTCAGSHLIWRLGKQEITNHSKGKEIVRHFFNLERESRAHNYDWLKSIFS